MQVTSKHLIEQIIMKENYNKFILAHRSPLLQDATTQDLGFSGEDQLIKNMILNTSDLKTSSERLMDLVWLLLYQFRNGMITGLIMMEKKLHLSQVYTMDIS